MRRVLTGVSALALTACATVDVPVPEIVRDAPADWLAPAPDGVVAEDWWTRFGDPALTALIDEAAFENPTILQAAARAEQALATLRIQGAGRLPQLSAGLNASESDQGVTGLGALGSLGDDSPFAGAAFPTRQYAANLNVSWEIDLWGRIAAGRQAALYDYLASAEGYRAARQGIAAQVARTYFAGVEGRQQVALSESTVASFAETARQVGDRAEVGLVAPNDGFLAESNYQSALAGLEQRRAGFKQTTRQLEVLLRDYPGGTVALADALPALPPSPPAGLPASLLARRPDVLAAEASLVSSGFRLTEARRAFLPAISLTGSYGTASSELEDLVDGDFSVWSIAGQIVQPIFQGGRLRGQVRLRDAQQDEAFEAYTETVLTAFREVQTALAIEANLAARERALLAAAVAAEEAGRIGLDRYLEDIEPFITIVQSQQRALDARFAYLAARRARLDNRIDLHLALGGGFGQPSTDAETP